MASNLKTTLDNETKDIFDKYISLLLKFNNSFNLISRKIGKAEIYKMVLVSSEIKKYIPYHDAHVMDLGSGNGILGASLCILGYSNITLLENNIKKASFLIEIAAQLKLDVKIINKDIRHTPPKKTNYDFIVCRAFSSISDAIKLTLHIKSAKTHYAFIKNSRQLKEIDDAHKHYSFDHYTTKSTYDKNTNIVILNNVKNHLSS